FACLAGVGTIQREAMRVLELSDTMLATYTERRDAVNGIPTFSRTLGIGEDVVLVHGVGVSSEYWRPAQRELAATGRYRVHAVDLPGFGRSAEPPWPPELPRLTEHLHAWAEAHVPDRFHLIGQSMGCELCVLYAAAW